MTKLSKRLLKEHSGYVTALKAAINGWEEAEMCSLEQRDYLLAIGEIGNEIRKMNVKLDMKNYEEA